MSDRPMHTPMITFSCDPRDLESAADPAAARRKAVFRRQTVLAMSVFAFILAGGERGIAAEDNRIEVKRIDAIVKNNPLAPETTAAIVEHIRAGGAEVGVLVMRKNGLHHHSHQDHVLYLVRGTAVAKLENAAGQIETRTVRPGEILSLPRGKKHGFEKSGDEDLVFLVVATSLPPGVEETTYHE